LTISNRWIYSFSEGAADDYSDWIYKGNSSPFNVGLGFTMKGSGAGTANQRYTFKGQPNTGDISASVSANSTVLNQTLVGNPYPSAIDADEFIRDNIPGGDGNPSRTTSSIDGTLYFWRQSTTNNTHITRDYLGGYATYALSGGVAAVSPPDIAGIGDATNVIPKQYIPVGQGFFVNAAAVGDQISNQVVFKNSHRIFVKESSGNSQFFRTDNNQANYNNIIRRLRLEFTTPENAIRPLLLAFTSDNQATEAFDYGYDALNTEQLPSDMSFVIDNEKYIIQGVGQFNVENMYPVVIDLSASGNIKIELTELENFEDDIDVYVYDALLGTYTRINDVSYQINLDAGSHENRYFIAFQEEGVLSIDDAILNDIIVNYLSNSNEIYIKLPNNIDVKQVYLMNMLGQSIRSWNRTNTPISQEMKIPVRKIAEGNYIIKVQTSDNRTINKKIIFKD
jgi:hypothetical protein